MGKLNFSCIDMTFCKPYEIVPWLITTSCLISGFQIFGRPSETLGRKSWYPVEGLSLDLQTSCQILSVYSGSDIQPKFSSNLVLKLTRWKKIHIINIINITTSCLISEFQMSCRTSETPGRGSWYPAEDLSLDFKNRLQILGGCL